MNALSPSVVDVHCVIQSLDRPLRLTSTIGIISAQPAGGERDPRIFIFQENLVLSIVPDGPGRKLIEIGEYVTALESLKGELNMPIERPVTSDKPYGHLRYNEDLTVCGFCHHNERPDSHVNHPNAYISKAFKPLESELISLESLRRERELCALHEERSDRCKIYQAIFDHGPVIEGAFPDELSTIFDLPSSRLTE